MLTFHLFHSKHTSTIKYKDVGGELFWSAPDTLLGMIKDVVGHFPEIFKNANDIEYQASYTRHENFFKRNRQLQTDIIRCLHIKQGWDEDNYTSRLMAYDL